MRVLQALAAAALLAACSPFVSAAPPETLTYQGVLGSASGVAVNGTLQIRFALYDATTGGTPLWDELQSVTVANGRFAVELGAATPLPRTLFASRLFLGIKVENDAEMTPRLGLSSTPYSMRAVSLLRNTTHVPADGTPQANGAALRTAIAQADGASADDRFVIDIDAGTFDLGNQTLVLPSFIELRGASASATTLSSSAPGAAVQMSASTALRALAVVNGGMGGTLDLPTSAIRIPDGAHGVVVNDVRAVSAPAGGVQGTDVRVGLHVGRASDVLVDDVDIVAARSHILYGLRSNFSQVDPLETKRLFRDVRIDVSAASNSARGADLVGRQDLDFDGLRIVVRGGGLDPFNAIGLRTQPDTGFRARNVDVHMAFAGAQPTELMGIVFFGSPVVAMADFRVLLEAEGCTVNGYRNGVVFRFANAPSLRAQQNADVRNGSIRVDTGDCFSGAVYAAGAHPTLDTVEIIAEGNQQATGYSLFSSNDQCNSAVVQEGSTLLRNSAISARSQAGGAIGMQACLTGFTIENSSLDGKWHALKVVDNINLPVVFSIAHSRLASTDFPVVDLNADGNARISHTSFDGGTQSPIRALLPGDGGTRAVVNCVASTTPSAFIAGPACPCSAGPDCPTTAP
jgi:hypothetical protein